MNDLSTMLAGEELERLDEFLLERIPEDDENWEEKSEGVFNVSMLDGFLTAVVSSLNPILPSKWIPVVWGDYEPIWESESEATEILTLMMRHMNGIVHLLMEEPENFEPMFLESVRGGETFDIVDDWCEGYIMGMRLDAEYWNSVPVKIAEELVPIYLFGRGEFDDKLDQISPEGIRTLQQGIAPAVRNLHAHALKRRRMDMQIRRDSPKVGRNDPCPCGSGLKYKKCCGQSPILH